MLNHGSEGNCDNYRKAVIDTLIAEVQDNNRCVLLLGYEDKMKDMFQNANPGLSWRFQIDSPFLFKANSRL